MSSNSNNTYLEAIEGILRESDRPLSAWQIYHKLREASYFDSRRATTPETAIRARISEDIKRNRSSSIFVRTGPGIYTLREKLSSLPRLDRSLFVVIEGLDGSGKTEVAHRLARILNETHPGQVLFTFEPHDPSSAGYFIRQVLSKEHETVSADVLALAFATNRADHYLRVIEPFLTQGDKTICICDRYYLSSLAYQAASEEDFERIMALNFAAEPPDLTIFLSASTATCYQRMKERQEDKELFEKNLNLTIEQYRKAIEFLRRERNEKIVEVNADQDLDSVVEEIGRILTGAEGADWVVFQNELPFLEAPADLFSLHGKFSLADFSSGFRGAWRSIFQLEEEYVQEEIDVLRLTAREAIEELRFDQISALFIQLLEVLGFQVLSRLPWSDVDALRLQYRQSFLKQHITFDGIALVLTSVHRQPMLTKKILDEGRFFDFVLVLDLRMTQGILSYSRDPIIDGDKALPPSTHSVTRLDIAELVLASALKGYIDCTPEGFLSLRRERLEQIVRMHNWETLWKVL